MERLTIEYDENFVPKEMCTINRFGEADDCEACFEQCKGGSRNCNECPVQKCFNRLAEYENTDLTPEQIKEIDRLYAEKCKELAEYKNSKDQELPCKVGDKVYANSGEFGILPYTVDCIVIDKKITYQCSSYSEPIGDCPSECLDEIEPDISDFGKTVFLTQKEAEKSLLNE